MAVRHYCLAVLAALSLARIGCSEMKTVKFKQHVEVNTTLVKQGATVWIGTGQYSLSIAADERDVEVSVQEMGSNPKLGVTNFYVTAQIGVVHPEYAGTLSVYVGTQRVRRQRPLFPVVTTSEFYSTGFQIELNPQAKVFPRGSLGVINSFMTKENYRELRKHSKTKLYIPELLSGKQYKTVTLFKVYSPIIEKNFRCKFILPDNTSYNDIHRIGLNSPVFTKSFAMHPTPGGFDAQCWIKYHNTPLNVTKEQLWRKQIEIVVFKEPLAKIIAPTGEEVTNSIMYPPSQKSANFEIHIYTTYRVTSLSVRRSDDKELERPPVVEFLAYPPGEICAKYQVIFPWLTTDVGGQYSVTVENEGGMVSHSLINISKAESLSLLVSPLQHAVGQGRSVSYFCVVLGHPISSLTWSRDFEPLNMSKGEIVVSRLDGDEIGLKLTFHSPKLDDSGLYICTASNQYEQVQSADVELAVYPPGSLYVSPENDSPGGPHSLHLCETVSGPQVLNMTEEELMREWTEEHSGSSVGVVLGTVGALVVLSTGVTLGGWLYRRRRREKGTVEETQGREKRSLTRSDSRLELIPVNSKDCPIGEVDEEWFTIAGDSSDDEASPLLDTEGLQILADNLKRTQKMKPQGDGTSGGGESLHEEKAAKRRQGRSMAVKQSEKKKSKHGAPTEKEHLSTKKDKRTVKRKAGIGDVTARQRSKSEQGSSGKGEETRKAQRKRKGVKGQ